MIKQISHVGIVVRDLDQAIAFYRDVLQLPVTGRIKLDSRGIEIAFLELGGTAKVELIAPLREDSAVARHLEKHGPGVHHLCFEVDDVEKQIERLVNHGVTMVDETPRPGAEGGRIAFAHPKSMLGALIEFRQPD